MNKFIQRILSKKRNVVILIILFTLLIGATTYTINGIQKNVQQMSVPPEDVSYFPNYPAVNTTGKEAAQIKRGEYLVKAGDCIACHTNTSVKGKTFAGGLPMQTPFGTVYSPNITPDKETGIGNWTDEDFIKAMREGISPQGHYYYPAFPYLYFNKITTDDLKAIKSYLDSIPAVHQINRDNDMVFPFNLRFLQLGWRLMFFYPNNTGPYQSDSTQSKEWNDAAYLVEGLGHCAMCHTPSYNLLSKSLPLGAPIRQYNLDGAPVQGYLAPNINKQNLGNTSDQAIYDVFTKDKMIGGGNIVGPMLEVNHDSLRYLNDADLKGISAYLKTVESTPLPKPKGSAGKGTYEGYCAGCHATGAGGAPKYGDASSWDPLMKAGINTVYDHAINGIRGMPAKGTCVSCSNDDIKQAVDYMVAAVSGPGAKMTAIPKQKKLTLEDGKRIYDANCSVCHNSGFKHAPKPGDKTAWKPIIDQGFVNTYLNVTTGRNGHPIQGACDTCSDDELIAAIKYMMQQSTSTNNYTLW